MVNPSYSDIFSSFVIEVMDGDTSIVKERVEFT
jgi:hypothetical protein